MPAAHQEETPRVANVLVVEDDKDTREGLCTYLKRFGHQVSSADSGQSALSNLFTERPDVIVLDLLMPGMDGAQFLEVIRSYFRLQKLPVIIWTGAGSSPVLTQAASLNPAAVLIKPRDSFPQILAAVHKVTHRH